jgi:excisionase family DNA binding protein
VTPRLLTAKAAARYLGVGEPTFRKWVDGGHVPVWPDPYSGRRRFSVLELDDWLTRVGRDDAERRTATCRTSAPKIPTKPRGY